MVVVKLLVDEENSKSKCFINPAKKAVRWQGEAVRFWKSQPNQNHSYNIKTLICSTLIHLNEV